jgi:hypothetical protein
MLPQEASSVRSYLQRFVFRRHRPFEVTLSGYAPHRLLVSIRDQRTNVGRPGGCRRPGLHRPSVCTAVRSGRVRGARVVTHRVGTHVARPIASEFVHAGRDRQAWRLRFERRSVKTAARSRERRPSATSDWMTPRISGFANTVIASSARAKHESCPIQTALEALMPLARPERRAPRDTGPTTVRNPCPK